VVKLRLKYIVEDVDRYGKVRLYFRRAGQPKVRLRGLPGSDEFMEAYRRALSGGEKNRGSKPPAVGSFRHLCSEYYRSTEFKSLDVNSTQSWRKRALDAICVRFGEMSAASMEPKHVRALRDQLSDKPGAARNRLKALKALFKWAIETGQLAYDPTRDIRPLKHASTGHHSWSLEEIRAFEDHYPVGSKARLAMALLLYTACRREDVVRFGPQHIHDGRISYRQAKNEHRNPIDLNIPVHPDLERIIAATPSGHLTFLATDYGRPFSVDGFGNKFRDWCNRANLPDCSAHGLRKATAARLAEVGCTAHEIMAITGHRSLAEVERYTIAARKSGLADSAMAKLIR
jgi:integrase/recombinase XerD